MSSATNTTQPAWVLYSSVLWVVLLSACASAPRWDWAERETLEMIAGNDAEAPAEILLWKSSIYTSSLYSDWLTRISEHRVYRVLQEDGLRYADQIVEFRPHGELVQFQARSISPSGEVRELSMDDLRHTESHIGFQFPLVELGSVLEFITVYEYDGWLFHQYGDTLPSDIPIRRLRIEIVGDRQMEHAIKVVNGPPMSRVALGDYWRATLAVDEVARRSAELFSPAAWQQALSWSYRLKRIDAGSNSTDLSPSWAHATKRLSRWLHRDDDCAEGLEPNPCDAQLNGVELVGCTLDAIHRRVLYDPKMKKDARKLQSVLDSGRASQEEMAKLLWYWLRERGFDARAAYGISAWNPHFQEDFPDTSTLQELLVHLPAQTGIEQPLFLDASCTQCAPGELPVHLAQGKALSLRDKGSSFSSTMHTIQAKPVAPDSLTYHYQLALSSQGEARVHASILSLEQQLSFDRRTLEQRLEDLLEWLRVDIPFATLQSALQVELDSERGKEERSFDFSYWIAADPSNEHNENADAARTSLQEPSELVLPLRLLNSGWRCNDEERTQDVAIWRSSILTTNIEVELPEGYELVSAPSPQQQELSFLSSRLSISSEPASDGRPGRVSVSQRLSLTAGRWPASMWPEHCEAMNLAMAARQGVLVFQRVEDEQAPEALQASESAF